MANSSSRVIGPAAFATAAGIFAVHYGGRATRDALFLSHFPVTALPVMVMATAVMSLVAAYWVTRPMVRWGPGRVIPMAFAISAGLLVLEWIIAIWSQTITSVLVYLHAGVFGALLISGFWTILSERLDPRTAKRQLGQVSAAGTLGGLAGGLGAASLAHLLPLVGMLPILALVHLGCAFGSSRLGASGVTVGSHQSTAGNSGGGPGSTAGTLSSDPGSTNGDTPDAGFRAMASFPYIRSMVVMVVLVTIADVLLDLVLKGRAAAIMAPEGGLLRFFGIFYTAVGMLTFLVQALLSRVVLERLGPARSVAAVPAGAALGAVGALAIPGLSSAAVARGGQSVLMASLFSAGYEVLFTPVPARDKRAIKSLVDVGASRVGDLLGAGIAQIVVWVTGGVAVGAAAKGMAAGAAVARGSPGGASAHDALLLGLAVAASLMGFVVAWRLQRGYIDTLARGLVSRAVHLELNDVTDSVTRSALLRTLRLPGISTAALGTAGPGAMRAGDPSGTEPSRSMFAGPQSKLRRGPHGADRMPNELGTDPATHDHEAIQRAANLNSRDPDTVRRALLAGPLPPNLYPRAVALLAWDAVAHDAIAALRRAGPDAVDALVEPLLDAEAEFSIRRRAPLVLGTIPHPRAIQALLVSLLDPRFEVRYRSGRALAHLLTLDPTLSVPPDAVYAAVQHEVATAAGVWKGRTLLDQMDDDEWSPVMDELVRERAERSLEHVFTLLSLTLPRKPLRVAFHGLCTDDLLLRGTALEYLESVLPPEVRKPLWPFLEPDRARRGPSRAPQEALTDLLNMNQSIAIKLEELRRKE